MVKHIEWKDHTLLLLDQRCLPSEIVVRPCRTVADVCEMIATLAVRGAPAIGIAAAYGLVLAAEQWPPATAFRPWMAACARRLAETRPTAVNLQWALQQMAAVWQQVSPDEAPALLLAKARAIEEDDRQRCRAIGRHGIALLPAAARILTHCHTGAIATGGYGTALGVIRSGHEVGKVAMVYADETRPLLQGARLTVWELMAAKIPVTLITDSMAASLMAAGDIDLVLTGADRVVANGDVANKIGTYGLAVLAHYHGLPFYVAAPLSTFDPATATGDGIVIEERDGAEVRGFGAALSAPPAVPVRNPAFDVTPHALIDAIITEEGILYPDYSEQIKALCRRREE